MGVLDVLLLLGGRYERDHMEAEDTAALPAFLLCRTLIRLQPAMSHSTFQADRVSSPL